jgi:hypothetical protein
MSTVCRCPYPLQVYCSFLGFLEIIFLNAAFSNFSFDASEKPHWVEREKVEGKKRTLSFITLYDGAIATLGDLVWEVC